MPKPLPLAAAVLLAALWCAPGAANDRVKLLAGNTSIGKLTEMSPTEVTVELGATKRKFPVNEIDTVFFDSEPNELTQARNAVRAGRYEDAGRMLGKIDASSLNRDELVQDVEFYKALAAARMALAGTGSKKDAGRHLLNFEKANKANFNYFEACETLGDLLMALGSFDQAESYYGKLAAAPWPDYKMRSGVLIGRALVGQKKFDKAVDAFDGVLAIDASGKEADRQKLAATLGKASALAGSGKTDEAIKSVEELIAKADSENLELFARAYTILGNCYKAAGKKKEALMAFLHVDLLYPRFPEQHAEALANLATLWAELDKPDRASQAAAQLKEKYPNSAWAQK